MASFNITNCCKDDGHTDCCYPDDEVEPQVPPPPGPPPPITIPVTVRPTAITNKPNLPKALFTPQAEVLVSDPGNDPNTLFRTPAADFGGGGDECCQCPLALETFGNKTYTGPGVAFGQWGWDLQVSSATSGIAYNGTLGRVVINEPGTYYLECTLAGQVENASGPWDYMTVLGVSPSFVVPTDTIFNCHLFSSGADSVSNCTSVRTLVIDPTMLPWTMEFAVILRDVPAPNTLTIFEKLTNFRIKRVCDETPVPIVTIPGFPTPFDGFGSP